MQSNNTTTRNNTEPSSKVFQQQELAQSKLFQLPENDPLQEREKFAISLRKEKKKVILDERRKKTYGQMSKQKCGTIPLQTNMTNSQQVQEQLERADQLI